MGLYNDDEDIEQLRALLIGKTIKSIERSTAYEAGIAKFLMEDGVVFDLCGGDLGWWIEMGKKK
jgi:hypothetical protein